MAVQFRYFFGGETMVRTAASLSRSEYARRGFFELVTVVALVVPMLLIAEWLIVKTDARAVNRFRVAAAVQVLLVLVIAGSAWQRMALYRNVFGLTELRVYTTAFMLWLAVILIWLSVTVLAGHRERFFAGAAISAYAALFILHAINPDALIVRTNAGRAAVGDRPLDTTYATRLSTDATPALITALPALGTDGPCAARTILDADAHRPASWTSWNWSRSRAHAAVAEHRQELVQQAMRCNRHAPARATRVMTD